jgi:hypothetical protein
MVGQDGPQAAAAGHGPEHHDPESEIVFLDDEETIGTQPALGTPLPHTRGGSRRRLLVAVFVLAGLAVGGLLAYHHHGSVPLPGPEAAVAAYFQDLAAGDAKDAAALATGPYQGAPVLAPQTLADAANRPSGLTIVSSELLAANSVAQDRGAGVDVRDLTVVSVKYTVHGAALSDTFLAGQDPKNANWELVNPYRMLDIGGGWSDRATVDGVSVRESGWIAVFPGAHVVAAPASPDFAPASVTAYPVGADPGQLFEQAGIGQVTLPEPVLSGRGRAAVQSAYRTALAACATQAETGFGDCGLDDTYDGYVCHSVSWAITGVAAVQVELDGVNADGSYTITASGSTASESGDYTDGTGVVQTFRNQAADVEDSYGTTVFHSDGSATITLTQ